MAAYNENPRPFDQDVLDEITKLEPEIDFAARAAGLTSNLFIAGPIAREMNKNAVDYFRPFGIDPAPVKNFFATHQGLEELFAPATDESLLSNHAYVQSHGISNVSSLGFQNYLNRAQNATLNDIGIAKINEGTAIDAIGWYRDNLAEFGGADTLQLLQYANHPAALVRALIEDPATNVRVQAIIARQAQDYFQDTDPNWNLRSVQSQAALITTYSVNGSHAIQVQHDSATGNYLGTTLEPELYNPSTSGSGGAYIMFPGNVEQLSHALHVGSTSPISIDTNTMSANNGGTSSPDNTGTATGAPHGGHIEFASEEDIPSSYGNGYDGFNPSEAFGASFAGVNFDYTSQPISSYGQESPSQVAGIGLSTSLASGNGGIIPDTSYDFTPGQTSNSVFDYSAPNNYSPEYDTSGNNYSNSDFNNAQLYYDDGFDDGGDSGEPVVLDLSGNGIKVTPLSSSNTFFDMAGDGYQHRTAWAGAGNGVLVLDLDGSGQITQRNQVVFTDWDPTATNDLQALADVFDTNHDGKLDAGDALFSSFKILVTNADGTTTLETLAAAGIQSIDLTPNSVSTTLPDGSQIQGQTSYTRTDGSTGTAATVSFSYDANGYAIEQTVTHNGDGSTTIDNKALNPDGSLANETTTLTSADGLTRTISFDHDGDGVFDQVQTIATVVNGDGSTTETLSNKTGAGVLTDKTVTTTSADKTSVSISRDTNGDGVADQTEVRTTHVDGSTSTVVTDLNPNASIKDKTTTTTSTDGLTKTVATDVNGDGTADTTTTDVTVIGTVKTHTVSTSAPDSTLLSSTVTTSSLDGQSSTIASDYNGDGTVDLTQAFAIVVGTDGSLTTTETDTSHSGTVLGTAVTTLSADGLSKTVAEDLDGDGTTDLTTSDVTVVSTGTRTETVSDTYGNGTLRDETITVKSSDGRSRSVTTDSNGDGHTDHTETIAIDGAGTSTDTVRDLNADGSLKDETITISLSGGLVVETEIDADGNGTIDQVTVAATVKNGDGSSTLSVGDYAGNGAVLDETVTTTSANGLRVTTQVDNNGDGVFDITRSDFTVINADGSRVETVTETNINGSLRDQTIVATSADRLTTTTTYDGNGDGYIDIREVKTTQSDGSLVDTLWNLNPDNSYSEVTKTTTSATGLSKTVQTDQDGNGTFDLTQSDVTVLHTDGSRTETVSESNANGSLRDQTVTTTSGNGFIVATQTDADGNGVYELTKNTTTTFNNDGSQTVTAVDQNADGSTRDASSVTTAENGLLTSTTQDLNGDGVVDRLGADAITLNSDGSRVETVTDRNASDNSLRDETVTTTSADQLTVTQLTDSNGDGHNDKSETISTASNGTVTDTVVDLNADGSTKDETQSATSANGLTVVTTDDKNGDGIIDSKTMTSTLLNADGSATVHTANYNGTTLANATTEVTSADGRTITTTSDLDGDGLIDLTKTDVTVHNTDGSTVETVTDTNQDGSLRDKTVTTTSADGKNIDISAYIDSTGLIKYDKKIVIQHDGSTLATVTYPNATGTPIFATESDARSTSANELVSSIKIQNSANDYYDVASNTVINSDGSRTTTFTNNNEVPIEYNRTDTVSADGLVKTTHMTNPALQDYPSLTLDGSDATTLNNDGSTTDTIINAISEFTATGTAFADKSVTTSSGDGLLKTVELDVDNNGAFDRTDVTATALDGSTTETLSVYNPGTGALEQKDILTTSFDGLSQTLERDKNGDGIVDHTETTVTNTDGSTITTLSDNSATGTLLDQFISTTSANGYAKSLTMDTNGDGTIDYKQISTTSLNADGSTRAVLQDQYGNGTARDTTITTTSANGLSTTTQYDINGDGVVDETQTDVIAYLANGTKTETITERYADGTLKDTATTTTTQNAYTSTSTTSYDTNGDGTVDRTDLVGVDQDGYRLESVQYYPSGPSNGGPRVDTGTSPDGLTTYYVTYNASGTEVAQDTLLLMPNANGSYVFQDASQTFTHTIDSAGVDDWVWTDPGTTTYHTTRLDLATEQKDFDIAGRLYDTLFDRTMSEEETQQLVKYITNGVLDTASLASDLLASTEFSQKYQTLTNAEFIERVYQNALGHGASLSDLTTLLSALSTGTLTRAALANQVSESAEHIAIGNEHTITNNTDVLVSAYALDHPTDKAAVSSVVQNLYEVILDRQATATEASTQSTKILGGTETEAHVAADILGLSEFTTKYGTLTDAAFVTQMFENALGRAPTSTEQSYWAGAITGATITRADFVDALANSADHLSIPETPIATAGNDTIYSHDGADVIDGLAGTDTVDYSLLTQPGVTVNLATGAALQANGLSDTLANIENVNGTSGADTITGNSGANVLVGGAGNDNIDGGDGNDTIDGGAGDDILNGNTGTDTVSYATAAAGVVVSLAMTTAQNTIGAGTDTLTGFENITGSAFNDTLTGSAGVNNVLTGGAGDDIYYVQDTGDVVTEAANGGNDTVISSVTYTLGANVENLTLTGTANLTATGNALNNVLTSNSGVDTLVGGAGDDTYFVNNTSDVITEAASAGTDTVYASVNYTLGANIEKLILTGSDNLTATGNALANVLISNSGVDTLVGGAGDDSYIVNNSADVVTEAAGAGTDTVLTTVNYVLGANVEYLDLVGSGNLSGTGNSLDNYITANNGNNVIDGGAGTDTVSYIAAVSGVDVSLAITGPQVTGAGTDTLTNIENLVGSNYNDVLIGSAGVANVLSGGLGDDTYYVQDTGDVVSEAANAGTDTVFSTVSYTLAANVENLTLTGTANLTGTGNASDNVITSNTGVDTLVGGAGNDTYIIQNASDVITEAASAGTDTVIAAFSYTLGSNIENLTLTGSANLTGTGNALANVLISNSGVDTLVGGAGDDSYIVNNSADVITEAASAGNDTVLATVSYVLGANLEYLTLTGSGNLSGTGNTLNNVITANSGNNILDGGAGTDTVSYSTALSGVDVSLAITGPQVTGGSGTDTLTNFENLSGSNYNDVLIGSAGVANVLSGGLGDDTYYVQDTGDVVSEAANAGTDTVFSTVSYTLGANVENLTLTGTTNLTATGNALNNVLTSNSGVDTLVGGAGNDTYIVNNSSDVITEASSAGTDTVLSSVTYTLGSNIENLTLTGTAAINATGNTLANTLIGNDAANVLNGGTGADTMIGHGGNDTYYVDNAADVVTETFGGGTDTVYASVSYTLAVGQEIEYLRGNAGSTGLTLTGNEYGNTIVGNTGADTINGGLGNDTLTGGSGADSFVFNTALDATHNVDTITDFTPGSDKIKLDNAIFTALGATQNIALPASAFYAGTAAHDADDHIIYNPTTGDLSYDPDGTGAAPAVLFAHLAPGLTTLAASDFTIV